MLFYPERISVRNSDGLIAVSKDTKEEASRYYDLDEDCIEVINNGVNLEEFQSEWSFQNKILFVGHLVSRKGPDKLLEAFEILNSRYPELELCFVGSGRIKDSLIEYTQEKNLQERVEFRQGVSDEELVDLYSESIFCLPSEYEGFGMVYIEAMAAGAPVLATEGTAIEEVIEDEKDGLMVSRDPSDIAENLERLIEDEDFRGRISRNARETAEEFDWKKIAIKTENYYSKVLDF